MKILVHISSQKKIFLLNLINKFLNRGDEVDLIVRDKFVLKNYKNNKINNKFVEQISLENLNIKKFNKKQILKKALNFEKKYNQNLSFLLGKDRALGRGYLLNVDNYAEIERANWSFYEKLNYFFYFFDNMEKIILTSKPKVIISIARNDYISILANSKKIKYLTIAESRIGSRYIWSDNDFNTSKIFISSLKKNLKSNSFKKFTKLKFEQLIEAIRIQSAVKYNFVGTLKTMVSYFIRELRTIILRSKKKYSYKNFAWTKVIIMRFFAYKYVLNKSVKVEHLNQEKFIYVPLHLEPEIALLGLSPEFSNSLEMITWLSKSVPSNFKIVVKEQPNAYGTRSIWFYKTLIQMPNVVLAYPTLHPWTWIKKSFCVATITGTSAIEAVCMKKPVLSYGKHQIVNYLPSVKYCNNFFSTKKNIDFLISKQSSKKILEKSKSSLLKTIYEHSFNSKDYANDRFTYNVDRKEKNWEKLSLNFFWKTFKY